MKNNDTPNDFMELLKNRGSGRVFIIAAAGGRIDIMEWLVNRTPSSIEQEEMIHAQGDEAFVSAARQGRINVMEWNGW
jgi:hypothetical protein